MTRDQITAWAREAGFSMHDGIITGGVTDLERFASLIAAAERNRTWTQEHWTEYERNIAAAEREACAKVCEELLSMVSSGDEHMDGVLDCLAAIRARKENT